MPITEENYESSILFKEQWEELEEFDFKAEHPIDYGDRSKIWERRIIITNANFFVDDSNPETFYPYISFINEEKKSKTERLQKTSHNVYTYYTQKNLHEKKLVVQPQISRLVQYLRDLEINNSIIEPLHELVVFETKNILEWLSKSIDLHYNLSKGYFPVPVGMRLTKYVDNIIVYSYQITNLSHIPKYLGSCKYND